MANIDPTPWFAAAGLTGGSGILGWLFGRRRRKAEAALTEAQAAVEQVKAVQGAIDAYSETFIELRSQIAQLKAEAQDLREHVARQSQEIHQLQVIKTQHGVLVGYISDVWARVDAGEPFPATRPIPVVAIVQPQLREGGERQ